MSGGGTADYKYIRATFSAAFDSLEPSEIEIRRKSDKQLFSVDTVKLSSDGYTADITLFGDKNAAGTRFLEPATIYVMTVTHDGFTDDFEFQLPDNGRDLIVTKVDVDAGKITVAGDGRTTNPTIAGDITVGDEYLGNLGYLVGRNVVVGINADKELLNFSVEDQDVVIAKVKYVLDDDGNIDKSYFETPDETKYYLVYGGTAIVPGSNTTRIAATTIIDAATGADITAWAEAADGVEYQYAKLVLNKNGTVATAVLQGADGWEGHIIVTSTDDTKVIESSDFALDFDGYTIVKDDEYVDVEDLEAGDILYYNTTDTFVDVYTEQVTGNIEKITSEKVTIDGEAYKWANAQYLKSGKYVTLDQTDIDSDLKYLYSLDPDEDTTITLNRAGTIQVIDGTVMDDVVTTSDIYVLTEKGAQYAIGKTEYIELVGSNGSSEKLVIDISKVKSYAGKDSSLSVVASGTSFKDKTSGATVVTATAFKAKYPVKITKNADGEVIGIELMDGLAKPGSAKLSDAATDQTIDSDSTSLYVDGTHNITLKSSTPVFIINDSSNDNTEPFSVEKTTIGELTKTAKGNKVTAYVKSSSTSAEYVIIDNASNDAWTTTDTETIGGIVKSITKGLNTTSGKEEVETITLLTANGEVELDADEKGYTGDVTGATYTVDTYQGFTVKKGTYELAVKETTADAFATATNLAANRAYSDSKFTGVDADGNEEVTVSRAASSKVYIYDAVKRTYTESTIGAINTKKVAASLKYHVVDANTTGVVTADIMVVALSSNVMPATVTLDASAFAAAVATDGVVGTSVEVDDDLTFTYTLQTSADGKTGWGDVAANANLTLDTTTGGLKVGHTAAPTIVAGNYYRVKIEAVDNTATTGVTPEGSYVNPAFSPTVRAAAQVVTTATGTTPAIDSTSTATNADALTANKTLVITGVTLNDQFGAGMAANSNPVSVAVVAGAGQDGTAVGEYILTAAGTAKFTITLASTATAGKKFTVAIGDKTLTLTAPASAGASATWTVGLA